MGASGLFKALTHKRISLKERVDHVPFLAGLFTSSKWIPLLGFSQTLIPIGGFSLVERDEEGVGRRVDRYRKASPGTSVPLAMDFPEWEIIWEKFGQYVRVYGIWSNRVVDV